MHPIAAALELLFPERCPACDAFTGGTPGLCARCATSLYPLGPACPRCGEPEGAERAVTCVRCLRSPPAFARTWAPWRFGGELAAALRRWKYGGPGGRGRPELTRGVAALLGGVLGAAAVDVDVIVPVPLHAGRLRERGFPQAERLVAAAIALAGGATGSGRRLPPHRPAALVRTRPTAVQASLPRAARVTNVAGAFTVPARHRRHVGGRTILLVDDVLTTGATADAAARALLAAGATRVEVLALARAEP